MSGERNYCYISRIRVSYKIDKIYKIQKIKGIINIFWKLKEDIQICIDSGYEKFWFNNYKRNRKRKFNKTYNTCLKSFVKTGFYNVVYSNP